VFALAQVQEGSIVRCIVRVGEACKELRNAARIMGEPKLLALVDEAAALIKRDVVFCNSLYLSEM
jgi:antiviral helicase SKI2